MSDHVSTPTPSKRKHLDGKGDQQQDLRFNKTHKISKKKKGKLDTVESQNALSATEAAAEPKRNNSSTSLQDATKPDSTTTPLPTVPKDMTRSVLAFSLLPRQVARAPARQPRVLATSSATVTPTTLRTTTTTTASTTKFRARDIMADVSSSKSVSTFRDSTTAIASRTTTATTTTVSTPSSEAIVTSKSTLIKAEPLFVIPNNNPNRYEFPYGNYPNYYEKRIQEQTKRHPAPTPSSASSSASKHSSRDQKSVQVWDKVWENQTDEAYYQRKHFRLSATPTVLFPTGCIKYTSGSGSSSTKKGSRGSKRKSTKLTETRMTLVDLAKKVDLRLEFLDPSWFRGKRVLDLGCNSALITVFIALHYKPQKIQGVDIDPSLIGKAQKFVLKTFSQLSSDAYTQTLSGSPPSTTSQETTSTTGLQRDDVPYEEYFPKALQKIHGTLPVPMRTERTEHLFPHNIELRVSDWVTESDEAQDTEQGQNQRELDKWDVILGFSLTKWIHLHHGDERLKKFFRKVYRNLTPGGVFVVEPQDYATYVKRSKITPEMKKTYDDIKFRPEEFRNYLVNEVGFRESQHLGQSDGHAKNFNRDIFLFRK
ncbi:hypothetical protein EC957_004599 [Mortierella hygrophila]|uniref:RNA methyltransferase n=1 Tax=Mortierella hygrophila TaxID=979708 RepID=A0A9P6F242_9FUNG|nr:hypothetical protein EC957_004599 [Mortierella hygrophila]